MVQHCGSKEETVGDEAEQGAWGWVAKGFTAPQQILGTVGGFKHLKRPIDILGRSLKAEDFYFIYINLFFEIPPHALFLQCQTSQEQEHGILWGISPGGSDFGHGA